MKKVFLFICALFCAFLAQAQSDAIYLHNGTVIKGKVVKVAEHTVSYVYENEEAEQTCGKYAVSKIVYGKSGREQNVTDKIVVRGKNDWDNVIVIENLEEVAGLKRQGEVKGKTAFINYRTAGGSDRKSLEYLKKEAAEMKCPFILLTSDKDIDRKGIDGGSFGQIQSIKKGIAYGY
jgi:sRNA-binding regulator protein Hfq